MFMLHVLQYTVVALGYKGEEESTVLELTYNYGVTEYSKGNGYAQVSRKVKLYQVLEA